MVEGGEGGMAATRRLWDRGVPGLFKCPTSLELMTDPVTLCTRQTYDRSSIAPWLEAGNRTCPATMLQLESLEVVLNHTLRRLIHVRRRWSRGVGAGNGGVDAALDLERVGALVEGIATPVGSKLGALKELRDIVRDEGGQRCVLDAGGFGVVTGLLASFQESCCGDSEATSLEVCEQAVAVLNALVPVCDHEKLKLGLVGCSGAVVASMMSVLSIGSLDSRVSAATVVAALAAGSDVRFQAAAKVFASLRKLLREDQSPKAVKASLRALLALCKHRRNHSLAVDAGIVPVLIELLPEIQKGNAERALCILELLCAMADGRAAVIDHDLAMAVFVSQFHTISVAATDHIVSILWLLCQAAPESLTSSQQAGFFAPLLLLLQMECAPETRHKCKELLKQVKVTGWKEISSDPHFFLPFITAM